MEYDYKDKIYIISGMIRTLKIVNTLYNVYKKIEKKPLIISTDQNMRKQIYIDFCCRMQDELEIINKEFLDDIYAKKLLEKYNQDYKYNFPNFKINLKLNEVLKSVRDYYTHPNSFKKMLNVRIKANKKLEILVEEEIMEELLECLNTYIEKITKINEEKLNEFSKLNTSMIIFSKIINESTETNF